MHSQALRWSQSRPGQPDQVIPLSLVTVMILRIPGSDCSLIWLKWSEPGVLFKQEADTESPPTAHSINQSTNRQKQTKAGTHGEIGAEDTVSQWLDKEHEQTPSSTL